MEKLKGSPELVGTCRTPHSVLELLCYPDGSWAIRRNGSTHSLWEADEQADCVKAFLALAGIHHDSLAVGDAMAASTAPWPAQYRFN